LFYSFEYFYQKYTKLLDEKQRLTELLQSINIRSGEEVLEPNITP